MKKMLLAIASLACGATAFGSVGIDRDKDGYEDGEATSGYVITSTYYTTEPLAEGPVVVRRQILPQEPFEIIPDDLERIRVFRRQPRNAPNHR